MFSDSFPEDKGILEIILAALSAMEDMHSSVAEDPVKQALIRYKQVTSIPPMRVLSDGIVDRLLGRTLPVIDLSHSVSGAPDSTQGVNARNDTQYEHVINFTAGIGNGATSGDILSHFVDRILELYPNRMQAKAIIQASIENAPPPSNLPEAMVYFASSVASCTISDDRPKRLLKIAADKLFKPFGIDTAPDYHDIVITNNSSIGLFSAACAAVLNPDQPLKRTVLFPQGQFDKYILVADQFIQGPDDSFVPSTEIMPLSNTSSFKISAKDIENVMRRSDASVRDDVALLVITNPTISGETYTLEELNALGEVIVRYNLRVVCDEIFAGTTHDGEHHALASITIVDEKGVSHPLRDHVMTITGASKAYNQYEPRFSAATTGDKRWLENTQEIIDSENMGIFTQGYEIMVAPYLEEAGADYLLQTQAYHAQRAEGAKKQFGGERGDFYHPLTFPEATPFAVLSFEDSKDLLSSYGITSNQDLMDYLYIVGGLHTGPLAPNRSDCFGVRINYALDTQSRTQNPDNTNQALRIAFSRIDEILERMKNNKSMPTMDDVEKHIIGEMAKAYRYHGGNDRFTR